MKLFIKFIVLIFLSLTFIQTQASLISIENTQETTKQEGSAGAKFYLGLMYYHSKEDFKTAFQLFKEAAEQGHHVSQYYMAKMLRYGEGTEQNPEEAFYQMKKVAEKGLLKAQIELAVMLSNGEGTKQNLGEAFYLIERVLSKMLSKKNLDENLFEKVLLTNNKTAKKDQNSLKTVISIANEIANKIDQLEKSKCNLNFK